MPTFAYRAKHGPDKTLDGQIVAESQPAAVSRLEAMGYIPVWIGEVTAGQTGSGATRSGRGRIASREVTVFTRQLAGLLRAGVPILRALSTIQQQNDNPAFRGVLMAMVGMVRDGEMLSEALRHYPRLFPELYINMVRSGESAGMLEEVLLRLAEARESDDELKSRVVTALAYPALVLTIGMISVFVILTFFLPRIVHLFDGMAGALPWPTRIVLVVSDFFAAYWGWIAVVFVVLVLVVRKGLATESGRMAVDRAVLRLPLVGRFARDTDIVRFARTLSLLVRAGIPVERALDLGGHTLANRQLRAAVLTAVDETVRQGATVAAGFKRQPEIPAFVTSMVAVGEESGRLDDVLTEVAVFYQRELERDLRLVTTLLEPALILIVGVVVGFIIFAMLLPIFQIGQSVR
jgi:type II secretory pathway component PulF